MTVETPLPLKIAERLFAFFPSLQDKTLGYVIMIGAPLKLG
jgi:hypothetical protein